MHFIQNPLENWLKETLGLQSYSLHALPMDASFRQYFRVRFNDQSYVLMDASRDQSSLKPYIAISHALRDLGLNTPEILVSDLNHGFLLISDFGDQLFQQALTHANTEFLYNQALQALSILQKLTSVDGWALPHFTAEVMFQELILFKQWFLEKHLSISLPEQKEQALLQFFHFLADACSQQPTVFMHRDYHSANLMLLPNNEIGILDFQDAFIGPVTYDLVSLIRDCYQTLPAEKVGEFALRYRDQIKLNVSDAVFLNWLDLMGLQRHLKALLTFSRKYRRDQNDRYLQHIPRTLNYILTTSQRYPECATLQAIMEEAALCVA